MSTKVVLITGCSSGIGQSLAKEALQRGFIVYATARNERSLDALQHEHVRRLQLDITDQASRRQAIETIREREGRIDYLINNAGQSLFGPLAEVPLAKVSQLLDTNLTAQLAMCQAVIPAMAEAGSGCIVNIGSMVGVVTTPFGGAYSATKAALHILSEALRMEVAPLGIRVVVVQPGAVRSHVADNAINNSDLARYQRSDSLYQLIHQHIVRRANASQDKPMPSDVFAQRVWDQLTKSPGRRVIRVGKGVGFLRLLSVLPQGVRQRIFSTHFGLDNLRDVKGDRPPG